MSDTAKKLFDSLAAVTHAVVIPGLKRAGNEIGAEFSRLGTQGATELAAALFNGHAFVLYGPGQRPAQPELAHGQERDVERGMER